ncbi:antibiotic biosynthesis monooxygenase [Streptomyces pactum]|uniref:Antibiotic biosynthesis monooxygenase n=1 Tax=Streptomyces pactum TaxID=68249 RepID=A0ABS0NP53_9ACTN|nr:antibiotic biosynthesis monooxygenase [Streptomyces pactum]MBH5336953.1 antibiotic biosynthesis monooxygenase [Streptomyces pactum]MBH5338837.1 antibiotic biosynthesis monooxygenase [Streptomyces pactum]
MSTSDSAPQPSTVSTTAHPDPARPGVGAPMFSTWRVGTPERQRTVADAIAATWEKRPWPAPDLLSYGIYAAADGDTLMHYSQWTSEEAYFAFFHNHRQERNDEIDAAVPGIERVGLSRYRLYRSHVPDPVRRAATEPGLIVTVDIHFDAATAGRRTEWIDTVIGALDEGAEEHRELLGAHFHLLENGAKHLGSAADRVLNYAEWTSEEAYETAQGADRPGWHRVRDFPGHRQVTGTRYRLLRHLTPRG